MQYYHLNLLDDNDQIASNAEYYGPDDLAVLMVGEKLCANNAVEIWQDTRFVAFIKKGGKPLNAKDPYRSQLFRSGAC